MEICSKSWEILGSKIEVKLPENFSFLFDSCFDELARIELKYSRFNDSSLLSSINNSLNTTQKVDSEFIYLLEKSLEFWKKTEGNFDISLKSALDRIGYDKNYSFKEKQSEIPNILLDQAIKIDKSTNVVQLLCEIEFGGFGKGFALDQLSNLIEKAGCDHYFLNAGGDIFAKSNDDQAPWPVLLEHPDDPTLAIGAVMINGYAIAASAPNRRKWGNNHHLLNAKTKRPANANKAIFLLAASGIEADAYSTAVFTAGFEEGIELSRKLPIELLLVSNKNQMYKSDGFDVTFYS